MPFIPSARVTSFRVRCHSCKSPLRRPRRPNAPNSPPCLTLTDSSRPARKSHSYPTQRLYSHNSVEPVKSPDGEDYHGWSNDFIDLCTSQFSLLASTIPSLTQALLFFRRENPSTGALEFVPLVVHSPSSKASRVWISSGSAGETEVEHGNSSRVLPGGIPAEWIIPDYPFKSIGDNGAVITPDGGLCIPVEYNGVLAGSVVLFAEDNPAPQWTNHDVERVAMVAKSIALGAALEGKWSASVGTLDTSRAMVESIRALLRVTLHQVRSPLSALITFGHLLLHKLPPGDRNRTLAKNIVLEALRLDDLLKPLDEEGDDPVLPEARRAWYEEAESQLLGLEMGDVKSEARGVDHGSNRYVEQASTEGVQLLWLSDVLEPQAERASVLAEGKGMTFVSDIEDDTPAVLAVEKYVRESVSNLIDNSLKYSPSGAYIGLSCVVKDDVDENGGNGGETVEVLVWDTGYGFTEEEKEDVFQFGFRGSAAIQSASSGSGIGLSTVREMLLASGAELTLESPLPALLDPRQNEGGNEQTPGSLFTLLFKRPSL